MLRMVRLRNKKCSEAGPKQHWSGGTSSCSSTITNYLLCKSYQGTRKMIQKSTKRKKKHTKKHSIYYDYICPSICYTCESCINGQDIETPFASYNSF